MTIISSAPSKIILLGEHSVVYGQPAIAVPISALKAFAEVSNGSAGTGLRIVTQAVDGFDVFVTSLDAHSDNPFVTASKLLLSQFSIPIPDAVITLRSDIPIASGLGSGAAITTALLRALAMVVDCQLSSDLLNDLVYETEKLFHGTPSGIDNTVIVYERPVYFVRNQPIEKLAISNAFTLLIGYTGISASTKVAVSDVRKLYDTDQDHFGTIFADIGKLVNDGRRSISNGDVHELGLIMNENHSYLQELTVSSPQLDKLVAAARGAGALGAKLSGGGRGGNMIALVNQETMDVVTAALLAAGAVHVYQTTVTGD